MTIDEQCQHQARRILFTAGAAMIDVEMAQGKCLDGIQDEVNEVIGGHPVPQIAGQQHRGLAVEMDEGVRTSRSDPPAAAAFKLSQKISPPKSDRLLAHCCGGLDKVGVALA